MNRENRNFNFTVIYKKGSEMDHVDALSRCHKPEIETCNQISDSTNIIKNKNITAHENLVHRGAQAVYEK